MATLSLRTVTDPDRYRAILLHLWESHRISNFDLIIGLNITAGRSFNDIFLYPMAPVINAVNAAPISPDKFAAAVSRMLFQVGYVPGDASERLSYDAILASAANLGCIIPHVYFSFPSFPPDTHLRIYSARRAFEIESDAVLAWASSAFHVTLPPRYPPARRTTGTLQCSITEKPVAAADFIGRSIDYFFVFGTDATLEIFALSVHPIPGVLTLRTFPRPIAGLTLFCPLSSMLLAIDVNGGLVYRISCRSRSDRLYHSSRITHIAAMGSMAVFVVDGTLLAVSHGSVFPTKRRTITSETSPIVALCASAPFGVAAYATAAGKLAIVSVRSARVLAAAEFPGERVRRLIVTDGWGFVIVQTDRRICAFSLSGLPLGGVDFPGEIAHWDAFSHRGADFVVLLDGEMCLHVFEAFAPETIKRVVKAKTPVVAMRACTGPDVLVVVTADGKAILLPLPTV
jgi:hypothetical protein